MNTTRGGRVHYRCSFCNKGQEEVRRLIAGPNQVYICDECVQLCREIIEEEEPTLVLEPIIFCPFCGTRLQSGGESGEPAPPAE